MEGDVPGFPILIERSKLKLESLETFILTVCDDVGVATMDGRVVAAISYGKGRQWTSRVALRFDLTVGLECYRKLMKI